jgi:hypothetical protein
MEYELNVGFIGLDKEASSVEHFFNCGDKSKKTELILETTVRCSDLSMRIL